MYLSIMKGGMCENCVRVSEITIFVGLIGEVISICSSEVRSVMWKLKLFMQLLFCAKTIGQNVQ